MEPVKKLPRNATLSWSVKREVVNVTTMANELSLRFLGETYLIDDQIMTVRGPKSSGHVSKAELKRLRAATGYFFDWHIGSVIYFARVEPGAVLVYAQSTGDDEEETYTRRVKTIRY